MSKRPRSIDDLLKDDDFKIPKYIPKTKREELLKKPSEDTLRSPVEQQVKRKKVSYDEEDNTEEEHNTSLFNGKNQSINKKGKPRFQFDWDGYEDTSATFTPLLEEEDDHQDIQTLDTNTNYESPWTKPLEIMTTRDWRIFSEDNNITTKGKSVPHPLRSWDESPLEQKLVDLVYKFGFSQPTPIQMAAIPVSLSKRDVVGVAGTGSGKTLAFLIPLFNYILQIDKNYLKYEHHQPNNYNQPLGLILAPTRELAQQITAVAQKFAQKLGLNVVCIIGGHTYQETIDNIESGPGTGSVHIVVATPGRLVDSLERNIIGLSKCWSFIMDEADRMIDMGFEKELNTVIKALPKNEQLINTISGKIFNLDKRSTMMFTATISPAIEKITHEYLQNPAYVYIGGAMDDQASDTIEQKFEYLPIPEDKEFDKLRFGKLVQVVDKHMKSTSSPLIIIFANFRHICETLAQELSYKGYKDTVTIHGSKSQAMRESAIEEFRNGEARVLIATDVAARGIDIPNVTLVINFQMTKKFDEYIHRIGRTGRMGNFGLSHTFISEEDSDVFIPLKKFLIKRGKRLPDWLYNYKSQTVRD
ncbi:Pre-mRNA-splicing ATP-dependent RNA helicase [Spathaspora sp. JA1]|nr:Pre-mRNA-splicing ATP-dependent RNA helicase [Spathaspora sp. JA1]